MLRKLGTLILWVIAIFMLSSVTIFNPGQVTDWFVRLFNIRPSVPELKPVVISERDRQLRAVAESVSEADLRETVTTLTNMGSRVPGYPGHRAAFEYVKGQFEAIGLDDVTVETFEVTVPVDKGASLTVAGSGEEIKLHCLWPNHVQTPSIPGEGATGSLLYAGRGSFEEMNGKPIEGSVVMMEFDCDQSFLNPRMLGAKAIIFYDSGSVSQGQALAKFLQVPVDVPRFWVEGEDAGRLLSMAKEGASTVTLSARMDWEKVPAWNISARLPGDPSFITERQERRWTDETIVLSSFYDAISVVPAVAPGAENATGMAALLEVAKAMKANPPKYNVMFLANGAHFQGLAGVNDFLFRHSRESEHFRELIPDEEKIDFRLFIGFDLSSEIDQVASFSHGTYYNPNWATNNYENNLLAPYADKFDDYLEKIYPDEVRHVDAIAPPKRTWKNYMPIRLGFDSEAVKFVGKEGITLATPSSVRQYVDTPVDRVEFVNFANLRSQVQASTGMLLKAIEDPEFFRVSKLKLQDLGHSLAGRILWFERDVDFAIPRVPVPGAIVTYQQPGPVASCGGVRTLIVDKTVEGPRYVGETSRGPMFGTRDQVEATGRFHFDIMRNRFANQIQAYELDADGRIVSAPDLGNEGDGKFPITQGYGWWENEMMEVLFKCRSISVFEIIDSSYLSALDFMTVLNAGDTQPLEFGHCYLLNQSVKEGDVTRAAVAFSALDPITKEAEPLKILMSTGLFGVKYLLINAPDEFLENPVDKWDVDEKMLERSRGKGYDAGMIAYPSFQAAKDMWVIDDIRMKQLDQYGIKNSRLTKLHDAARESLLEAQQLLAAQDYEGFIAASRQAWGLEARGYPEVMSTANDTVRGIIFYFMLLLPFSFFAERLLFGFPDITRRIVGFAGIFVLFFIILRFVHPAFQLSGSRGVMP